MIITKCLKITILLNLFILFNFNQIFAQHAIAESAISLSLEITQSLSYDEKYNIIVVDFATPKRGICELGRYFNQIFSNELNNESNIKIVPREDVHDALSQLDLKMRHLYIPDNAQKIGNLLEADALIIGEIIKVDDAYRIDVQLIDLLTTFNIGIATVSLSADPEIDEFKNWNCVKGGGFHFSEQSVEIGPVPNNEEDIESDSIDQSEPFDFSLLVLNVNLLLGIKQLDNEYDSEKLSNLDNQIEFGADLEFGMEDWPVMLAGQILFSSSSIKVSSSNSNQTISLTTTEINMGVKKWIEIDSVNPYLGGGVSFASANLSTTGTKIFDMTTGSGTGLGVWLVAGLIWNPVPQFNLGIQGAITGAALKLGDAKSETAVGGSHLLLLAGWHY